MDDVLNGVISFQSPRSGKFESNRLIATMWDKLDNNRFNPLDRGNLNQIYPLGSWSF